MAFRQASPTCLRRLSLPSFGLILVLQTVYFLSAFATERTMFPNRPSVSGKVYKAAREAYENGAGLHGSFRAAATLAGRAVRQTDNYGGEGFFVKPLVDVDQATIVILHGVSGNGQEWGYIALCISYLSLNYVRFVLPTAPRVFLTYKDEITNSWFDIFLATGKETGFQFVDEYVQCNATDMAVSVARVENIMNGEHTQGGIPQNRIFLLGFSQGGALAYTAFMKTKLRIGGLMGISTWMPFQNTYPAEDSGATKGVDIFMQHGTDDRIVTMEWFNSSTRNVQRIGRGDKYKSIVYPGQGHALVTAQVITEVENFVKSRAPGETEVMKQIIEDLTKNFATANEQIDRFLPDNSAKTMSPGVSSLTRFAVLTAREVSASLRGGSWRKSFT